MVPLTVPFGDDRHVCILEVKMKEGTRTQKTTTDSSPPCPFLGQPSIPLQKLGLLQKQTLGSRPNAAGKARRKKHIYTTIAFKQLDIVRLDLAPE